MRALETFDSRREAIAGRMRRLLNEGMLALLAGLGSRAGWLDALVAVQPAGVAAVARAARADEERVRAWLAALVAGGLVELDGARETYSVEPELAAFLRSEQGQAFLRGLAQLVALAADVDSPLVAAAPLDEHAAAGWTSAWTRELAALVPALTERLTLGLDVLELRAAGPAVPLASVFPASRFVAGARAPRGARFALVLALDERVLARPRAAALVAGALAPGGVAVLGVPALSDNPADDALHPVGAFLLGARALSPPASRAATAAPLGAALAAAGLDVGALARVPSDPFRNYLVAHKPASRNQ